MTINELKQTILNKMSQADQLCISLRSDTAPADAEDTIEQLSNEIEQLSDRLAVRERVARRIERYNAIQARIEANVLTAPAAADTPEVTMRIVDLHDQTIPACCVLEHKGYKLSMSTLLDSWGHGIIIRPDGEFDEEFPCTPAGIAKAVRRIDYLDHQARTAS